MTNIAAVLEGRPLEPVDLTMPSGETTPWELMTLVLATAARIPPAILRDDIAGLRTFGTHLGKLAEFARPGSTARYGICFVAGWAWIEVARRDQADRTAARQAARWYGEAVETARGPQDPLWANITLGLGESLRLAGDGDRARSRELGRAALRGHELNVLLQAGTDHAIQAAHAASADAAQVAAWCLADMVDDELLSALDAGRGLVLRAATASKDIAAQLTANGNPELAKEWEATHGMGHDRLTGEALGAVIGHAEAPDDLRSRVIEALGTARTVTSLLGVTIANVQRALRTLKADALVFLMPSTPATAGAAVIVPTRGVIDRLDLPGLVTDTGSTVHNWIETSPGARDANLSTPSAATIGVSLEDVCQWAWAACVEHLVDFVRRWHLGGPARLVLIPMGMLGVVPWHAAYASTGGRRRYAIQDMVFSYAISARGLCATARHPIRPITSSLVIGDPSGDLEFAGIEASAVHRGFYSDGTYLGRSIDGTAAPATRDAVLQWLASASGASTLHLASHASVDPRFPADAHLLLAGGEKLAARTLLEASRLGALAIDQVFLAACTTNVIGEDYDEAFSLATAFLAAGAHTVFGSLWPVPDTETSLLMYMVHHHLNVNACAPMDALHRAQLWMLDPGREPSAGMPSDLIRFCGGPAPPRLAAWAGFTHLGR